MTISVQASQSSATSSIDQGPPPASAIETGASLLPTPTGEPQTDAMSWLYLFLSKQQSLDVSSGTDTITNNQKLRDQAYKQEMDAIKASVEASEHSSFWSSVASVALDVGKVAAVVGSVAVAVATGGAGVVAVLAVAGAVLSTAGFAEGELHILEKMGVSDGTAQWIGIGLSVAGAACSGGAGIAASGADAADDASTAQKLAATAGKTASAASGVATAAGGAAKIEAGSYAGDQQDDLADAMKAQFDQQKLLRLINSMIDDLKASSDADDSQLSALRGALQIKGDTMLAATTLRV